MKVHHIAITVKNSEASVSFYKNNFGFREIRRFTKPGWNGSAIILELGRLQLELFQFQSFIDKKDELSNLKVIGTDGIPIELYESD